MGMHRLSGSKRELYPNARPIPGQDPNQRIDVTVILRMRAPEKFKSTLRDIVRGKQKYVERENFGQQFGADPNDIAAVKKFAQENGLTVETEDAARRTAVLSGTVVQMQNAFNVQLQRFQSDGLTFRGRTGYIHIPDALRGIVEAVLGLDERPQAHPHFRLGQPKAGCARHYPTEVAKLYNFPSNTQGEGQCIGIIELGGGFKRADLDTYFKAAGVPRPTVTSVSVRGAKNKPTGKPNSDDAEVMLDIEIAGAIAPAARIAVYFAPHSDVDFFHAITTAIFDTVNKPSVVSISWGSRESDWTRQAMHVFDQVFQSAALMGITICCSSGDHGSSCGASDGCDRVEFPASSHFVLACGGTRIRTKNDRLTSESVWNDPKGATGGGVSTHFRVPSWQKSLKATTANSQVPLKFRGVPDVSGNADKETGYRIRVDGTNKVAGGTSAATPLWAALIALINSERQAPVGFINPKLYGTPSALKDVKRGNNGTFYACAGWDACTGLGSPHGNKIAAVV